MWKSESRLFQALASEAKKEAGSWTLLVREVGSRAVLSLWALWEGNSWGECTDDAECVFHPVTPHGRKESDIFFWLAALGGVTLG